MIGSNQEGIRVAIVIVNYRTAALTIACLKSLADERGTDRSFKVIVVDGCSGEGEVLSKAVVEHGWGEWVTVMVADRNGGFSFGNNCGIRAALEWPSPPAYFLLLNPDTEVRPGAVGVLVRFLDANPQVGIAGSSFENPDGSEWPIAFRFLSILSELERGLRIGLFSRLVRRKIVAMNMEGREARVDWVAGASMMVRKQVFDSIGLMDEAYFLYYEEVDFCLRALRAGWPCWYVPSSRVMHISGQATGVSSRGVKTKPMPGYWFESRTRYFVKNHGVWYARLADLAYGLGLACYKLRVRLTGRQDADPPNLLSDFFRHSILFRSAASRTPAPRA
jgi:N-acetylglucosaminyl-diphospho-decaprenol L-rhamnosyltransferase